MIYYFLNDNKSPTGAYHHAIDSVIYQSLVRMSNVFFVSGLKKYSNKHAILDLYCSSFPPDINYHDYHADSFWPN